MINESDFAKLVLGKFDDLDKKMDRLHEDTNGRIQDLCDRVTDTNTSIFQVKNLVDTHIAVNEAIGAEDEKNTAKVDRKFYIIVALFGIGSTIVNYLINTH